MIDAHRGAFEYDWRNRFHVPLSSVGESMSWGEAIRLTAILAQDTASQVAAAVAKWDRPVSREELILMDQWDAYARVNFKKPEPHPGRPWANRPDVTRRGDAAGRTPEQVREILNAHGHNLN